ncbi:MAG: TIGR02147 family protein, partial [Deltaproteobacteria bacterium]|nr:TIGR02147 family protein [Deltaproteobacteria bacterium]
AKAKQAIAELTRCGLLVKKGRSLKRNYTLADTTDEMSHILIKNYHQKNLQKASQSVFEQEVHERELSSLTFTADAEKLKRMKDKIKGFRKEFFKLMDEPCDHATEVHQFNMQLFRLTKPSSKTHSKETQ